MKTLNVSADVTNIGISQNGRIMCEVEIYYKTTYQINKKKALHIFDVTKEIEAWEK